MPDCVTDRASARAKAAALTERFLEAGAQPMETGILQPADLLLDLYGEDIRARAYITSDTLRGEQMLRPDFTVPVVQMHMSHGAEPARYTYTGEVFRRQDLDADRASEFLQVGYEIFQRDHPHETDAELFALFSDILAPLNLRTATGDIGILKTAVAGLQTSEARKAALARHIWRPKRFRALLNRFAGKTPVPEARQALLNAQDPLNIDAPLIGLRGPDEITRRIQALRDDAATDPISENEVALLDAILAVRAPSADALSRLRDIAVDLPAINVALDGFERRLDALAGHGIDSASLDFEASYGRTQMEYYDGFVFGFYAPRHPDMPPVALGGRYDALTRHLGGGREIPATGGVIRPELVIALEASA